MTSTHHTRAVLTRSSIASSVQNFSSPRKTHDDNDRTDVDEDMGTEGEERSGVEVEAQLAKSDQSRSHTQILICTTRCQDIILLHRPILVLDATL